MNCTLLHLVCSWCRGTPTHFCGDERFCDECWARYWLQKDPFVRFYLLCSEYMTRRAA